MRIQIDNISYKDKQLAKKEMGVIKPRIQTSVPIEMSISEFTDKIQEGYTFSPAVLSGGCKSENWIEQQVFCVDVDNDYEDSPLLTVEEALSICRNRKISPVLYYPTYSHSDKKPKFRLVFLSDTVIRDNNARTTIMECLTALFAQGDTSCKNADRIFYGTNKEAVVVDEAATFSVDDLVSTYIPDQGIISSDSHLSSYENNELERLKNEFDLFDYMRQRNGELLYSRGNYTMFKTCELCGHKEDLVYYRDTNRFKCFGANCNKGGTIIDYLMISQNMNVGEAIRYFKHTLCGIPEDAYVPVSNRMTADEIAKSEYQTSLAILKPEVKYSRDDKGISELFADLHKDFCRYNPIAKEWFYYNGKVWVEDPDDLNIRRMGKHMIDELTRYSASIKDEKTQIEYLSFLVKMHSFQRRKNMIDDAKDKHYILNDDLDTNVDLLNCINGTLNLRTFEFREHQSSDMLSKMSNVFYDPTVRSERFEAFIDEIMLGDIEKIKYLQKILGYSLTADNSLEACFLLYGNTTRNGKSTLVETIAYMLGGTSGYAMNMNPETLAQKVHNDSRQASGDIARLKGCRFLSARELPKGMIIDSGLLKSLTGRDTITARHLYGRLFQFYPYFKLFINTNYLPVIPDDTLFDSGRLIVIPFERHFSKADQDKTLKDTLKKRDNITGVFNWCIEGLRLFRNEGLCRPKCIDEAIELYRGESDKINNFIKEMLIPSDECIKAKDVYDEYLYWCAGKGLGAESKTNFLSMLRTKKLLRKSGTVNGQTAHNVIYGYSLSDRKQSNIISL